MKDVFKEFYNIEKSILEELWKDEKTIFVFDTNVLLSLYGYAKQTRDDFFSILEALNEKLWIPYHVGLEYQRRRLTVIKNEKIIFNNIEANLDKIQKVFKGDFEKLALKRRFPKLFENTEKLEREISKSISNYRKSVQHWDSAQPCVSSHDEIRDRLNDIFYCKVGEQPKDQKWLDDLYKIGEDRFKKKIPPGFKDDGKGSGSDTHFYNDGLYYERKYGDLILWMQLIERAKSENVENVIFVTDDAKEDWWYKIDLNGKKNIGPLAELQSEIYRESKIKSFHMYSTPSFMEDGKKNLAVKVDERSIKDAEIHHLKSAIEDYEKGIFDSSLSASENMKEIIHSYGDSFDNVRQMENKIRLHRKQLADSTNMKEILRSYRDLFDNNKQIEEKTHLHRERLADVKTMREKYLSSRDFLSDREKVTEILHSYLDKDRDDDLNKE